MIGVPAWFRKQSDFILGFILVTGFGGVISGFIDAPTVSMRPNPIVFGGLLLLGMLLNMLLITASIKVLLDRRPK